MIDIQGQAIRERYLALDRLAAFVDGVFAIAATLLALEVTVPVVHEAATGPRDRSPGSMRATPWPESQWPESSIVAIATWRHRRTGGIPTRAARKLELTLCSREVFTELAP